jgi:phosphoglycerol transferase
VSAKKTARSTTGPTTGDPRREALFYATVLVAAVLTLILALQLWRADLRVPFADVGDAVSTAAGIKGFVEHGLLVDNPSLGAPGAMNTRDFPGADILHVVTLWLIGLVARDAGLTMNLFYLLGFPLSTLTAAFAMRRIGLSRPAAFVVAQLFAFAPYHFLRNEVHLFLASYWAVPLALVVCWWLLDDDHPLFSRVFRRKGDPDPAGTSRTLAATAMCAVLGATGVYFAYFACFFLLVAGIAALLRSRDWRRVVASTLLIGVICLVVGANVAPTILYRQVHGRNQAVASRPPVDAVIYSLKIDQMLEPTSQYFIPYVAYVKGVLNKDLAAFGPMWAATADLPYLGLVGGVAFVLLVLFMLFRAFRPGPRAAAGPLDVLGLLALAGTLLGTTGGFGAMVAVVFRDIRAYDRISIFIALFALAAAGVGLDRLRDRLRVRRVPAAWWYAALTAVLLIGLVDQVGSVRPTDYPGLSTRWADDGAFVQRVEASLAPGSMVFQLPYMFFPETPAVNDLPPYDHFKAYLHSKTLRWSYGAINGRSDDAWQRKVTSLPARDMVLALREAGFAGVWVDRRGYADHGRALESQLAANLGVEPLVKADGTVAFFSLTGR